MKDALGDLAAHRTLLYVILLSVSLMIGAIVLSTIAAAKRSPGTQVVAAPATAIAINNTDSSGGSTALLTPTIALATPWGVIGLDESAAQSVDLSSTAATPLPDLPPVVLLGPPPGSQFHLADLVTFYWDWPEILSDDLRFSVYLQSGNENLRMGAAEADNLGTVQQLGVIPGAAGAQASSYLWQVVVEDSATGDVLARSEQRPIVLLADGNR